MELAGPLLIIVVTLTGLDFLRLVGLDLRFSSASDVYDALFSAVDFRLSSVSEKYEALFSTNDRLFSGLAEDLFVGLDDFLLLSVDCRGVLTGDGAPEVGRLLGFCGAMTFSE